MNYFSFNVERVAALSAIACVFLLLVGPYWWPGEGSSWASVIRLLMLPVAILFLVRLVSFRGDMSISALLSLALLLYLLVNSIFVAESSKAFRRILVIGVFVYSLSIVGVEEGLWKRLLSVVAIVGVMMAFFSIANKYLSGDLGFGSRKASLSSSGYEGIADFGNTIVAGMHYAYCFIFSFWLMLCSKSIKSRVFWGICSLVIVAYVFLTYARTSWAAVFFGGLALIFLMLNMRVKVFLGVAGSLLFFAFGFFNREFLAYEFSGRGLTHRDDVWLEVFSRVSNIYFGVGAGVDVGPISINFGRQIVNNAHSLYLEVFYQFGGVGLFLMLATMLACAFSLFLRRADKLACLWLSMLFAGSIVMVVELNSFVNSPNLVWVWFWLPVAGAISVSKIKVSHASS